MVKVAELAEKAEMYDDMRKFMAQRASLGGRLNTLERSLFSDSFKESISSRRDGVAYLGTLSSTNYHMTEDQRQMNDNYKSKVEAELAEICREAVELIDNLLPAAEPGMEKAFYLKMKADYYRYRASASSTDSNCQQFIQDAHATYYEATNEASSLPDVSPIRLQVALNYSVFQKEVLGDVDAAICTAKAACQIADVSQIYQLPENDIDAVLMTQQLLKGNLVNWEGTH